MKGPLTPLQSAALLLNKILTDGSSHFEFHCLRNCTQLLLRDNETFRLVNKLGGTLDSKENSDKAKVIKTIVSTGTLFECDLRTQDPYDLIRLVATALRDSLYDDDVAEDDVIQYLDSLLPSMRDLSAGEHELPIWTPLPEQASDLTKEDLDHLKRLGIPCYPGDNPNLLLHDLESRANKALVDALFVKENHRFGLSRRF